MIKPKSVPHDIWIACDNRQRQWLLDEDAKANRISRIRVRIDAAKAAKSDAQHEETKRKWETQ